MEPPHLDDIVRDARRSGSVPWSAMGRRPPARLPAAAPAALAGWLSRTIDRAWEDLGRPDPLVVVDAGAGDGSRAVEVLRLAPRSATALRWLLVDDDPEAQPAQHRRLAGASSTIVLDAAAEVLGPMVAGADPDAPLSPPPRIGPLAASVPELPSGIGSVVVLAIGWLSRLPADLFEWRGGCWWEVRVAAAGSALREVLVEAGERAPGPPARPLASGNRLAGTAEARRWLAQARRVGERGWVVAVEAAAGRGSDGAVDLARLGGRPPAIRLPAGEAGMEGLVAARWSLPGG